MIRFSIVFNLNLQYSGHATTQDITTMAEKLSKSNSTSFPIAEKTLYANQALKIILTWIHQAYGGWLYDDSNYTDFPEATTTLTSDQTDYVLPIDATVIQGVSIKQADGTWYPLIAITLEQIQDRRISESEFYKVSSTPRYYRPLANAIKIYPPSNYTLTSAIKVYESRDASLFTITDTTKTPGFDSQFHEAVATYVALQYAKINGLANQIALQNDWILYEQRIKQDYSRRFAEMFPPRLTVRDATVEFS